jgi:hypothetical protein
MNGVSMIQRPGGTEASLAERVFRHRMLCVIDDEVDFFDILFFSVDLIAGLCWYGDGLIKA